VKRRGFLLGLGAAAASLVLSLKASPETITVSPATKPVWPDDYLTSAETWYDGPPAKDLTIESLEEALEHFKKYVLRPEVIVVPSRDRWVGIWGTAK
jgi:hypothetical protein